MSVYGVISNTAHDLLLAVASQLQVVLGGMTCSFCGHLIGQNESSILNKK